MGKNRHIPRYAHYYMDEDELDALQKEILWEQYCCVGKDFNKLQEHEKEWFKKYFPEEIKQ